MKEKNPELIEFKIPQDVLESKKLNGEQKVIWMIANKLNENKESYMQVIESVLCVSKHRIYKMINDMVRNGYLQKITITKEVKGKSANGMEKTSYLVALVPTVSNIDLDSYLAPF